MSSKHPKPGGNKPHSRPHQAGGEHNQCNWDGNARVTGELEVEFKPNLIAQHKAEQEENTSHNKKTRRVAWLTLIAVIIYAGLTAWQGWQTRSLVRTAQDTYNAVDRPYVGTDGASAILLRMDGKGKITRVGEEDRASANMMSFNFEIKNYGAVPALNKVTHIETRIDGVFIPTSHVSDRGSEMFPGETFELPGSAGIDIYPAIASGKSVFQVDIRNTYEYAGRSYEYCEREQYYPLAAGFINLGPMCGQPWTKGE